MTKLSSRGSKLLESFFTPEGKGQKAVEKKVQAKKWKSVFYKYVEMTASEMECLQLLQRVKWMPLRHCTSEDVLSRITEESGLLALGYSGHGTEVRLDVSALDGSEDWAEGTSEEQAMSPESDTERDAEIGGMNQVNYCYVEVVTINIREFLVKLLQRPGATIQDGHSCADIHHFIWHPSGTDQNKLYCKWYPVRPEILNQGCVRECLESALGHRLKYNAPGTCRER
uniref:Uncharacterized protein n=1 Tax=Callorhinchus milii TaxID=7868 RepID=A0A4W3H644_CALMI